MQAFLPLLRAGRGRVINISAPAARVPMAFLAALSASKAGVVARSDALRLDRYVSGADARMAGVLSRLPAGARERLIAGLLGIGRSAAAPAS